VARARASSRHSGAVRVAPIANSTAANRAARAGAPAEWPASARTRNSRDAFAVLLRRTQGHGAVHPDAGPDEVYALLVGCSRAAVHARLDGDVTAGPSLRA